MKALIRSEWRKLRTTRTAAGLGLAVAAVGVITGVATKAGEFAFDEPLLNPLVRNMPIFVGLFVLVLGIRSVTDDFRYGTVVPTVLATPVRGRIVAAKAIVAGLAGLVFALVAEGIALGIAIAFGLAEGPVALHGSFMSELLIGTAASGALTAVIGVGIGAVVRHQIAAVVGGVAWFFVAEDLLAGVLKDGGKWLPAQATHGLTQVARADLLAWKTAAVALVVYAVVAVAAGAIVMQRRDVVA